MIPSWLLDVFAALMLAVAAVSGIRLGAGGAGALAAGRPRLPADADADAAHVLMGIAMAGSLASGLSTLPGSVWAVVFAILVAWFAWRVFTESRERPASALASGHHVPHLVHSAAMVYMFVAVTGASAAAGSGMAGMAGGSMSGMGTLRAPTIGVIFVLMLIGWVVVDVNRISTGADPADRSAASTLAPWRRRAVAVAGPAVAMPAAAVAVALPASAGADREAGAATEAAASGQVAAKTGLRVSDPRIADGCRIAMGVTMALMLILMI
jgi:Domain of unknown function (DUF5134)